ncbi:MAG: hypothetical protein JJT94_17570 [Bernardetiaceae bacterium]|nr:hypothetical protein [Bernardetiaceae bacterium]
MALLIFDNKTISYQRKGKDWGFEDEDDFIEEISRLTFVKGYNFSEALRESLSKFTNLKQQTNGN